MARTLRAVIVLSFWLAGAVGMIGQTALAAEGNAGQDGDATVALTRVSGVITPVIADHLSDVVAQASREGHDLVIVQLDTPGGLVTSMREIVQTFLNAEIPVVVYVSPRGADAGSAGTFITMAAHVAAMAPGTTIGAATPVDLEGGEVGDKIVNNAAAYAEAIAEERGRNVEFAVDSVRDGRSIAVGEALEIGAIDLVANDLDHLLAELDGREVEVEPGGGQSAQTVTLETEDARVVELQMSGTRRLLQRLADPNLAFIFLSIGTLAIIYEVASAGMGAGGILGAVFLILAMFSLAVLPVNLAGVLLILLAAALFLVELFVPGVGVAAAGGTVALILGGIFLFQEPTGIGIDPWVLFPVGLVLFGLVIAAGYLVRQTREASSRVASDALIGRTAKLRVSDDGRVRVVIDGVYWSARQHPDDRVPLHDGDPVTVLERDNLDLLVVHERAATPTSAPSTPTEE